MPAQKSIPLAPHFKKIFIPLNVLALIAWFLLYRSFQLTDLIYIFCGWLLIGGYGIAIGYHRLFSHRSFRTSALIEKVLAFLGVYAGQGSSLFWVAVHRGLHHPFADQEPDLHSPIHGHFNAYLGWQMRLDPRKVTFKKCGDLLRDPWHIFLHKNYVRIFWLGILTLTLLHWKLGLYFLVIPSFISMHTENCVDLFCHLKNTGYRNYQTPDNSGNVWWLGYFGFGQGWHNNHHHNPAAAVYSVKWWELDLTRILIWPIRRLS